MKRFIQLFEELDATQSTLRKLDVMATYFREAPPEDAVWALYYLSGRKQKRLLARAVIQSAVQELSGLSEWLFSESYQVVGDLAETVALLCPPQTGVMDDQPLHIWIEKRLPTLTRSTEPKELLKSWWQSLDSATIFMVNKLITGGFRVGVSARLVTRALSQAFALEEPRVAEALIGDWPVTAEWFTELKSGQTGGSDSLLPYPFFLASPIADHGRELGEASDFAIEWKWDGIRAQLVKRGGESALWSRGEELISHSFPEILALAADWPDGTVLDGEIMARNGTDPASFAALQKRLQRKKISDKMLREVPAFFMAFDCLEMGKRDLRTEPLRERRAALEKIQDAHPDPGLQLSRLVDSTDWDALDALRQEARERGVEGLMLKRWSSPYQQGRKRGDWWKWKIDPYTLDAVLLYAQAGHGRRATLLSDYTFGIWKDGQLVPFAKAYSGLTNEEIGELDNWIRRHTLERFGPVRSVKAERVFELAFEGIQESRRHKAGIAVRFPRILRERKDKSPAEADSLETALNLLRPTALQQSGRADAEVSP